jgi:hypothetical protein
VKRPLHDAGDFQGSLKSRTLPNSETEKTRTAWPAPSRGLLSEIRHYLFHKPPVKTLIEFTSEDERKSYSQRIMQRLGIDVTQYAILNVHRIGIEVPVRYVFEELLNWDGDSVCWPNRIASVERMSGRLEHIQIYLLGRKKTLFGLRNGFLGLKFIPLFELDALKFQAVPSASDFDNARYLLYECSGGYPIGIFTMYVRSSIPQQGEREQTQLFLAVGFNFYGREDWPKSHIVSKVWETIHNRVTSNIVNRFKQMCESKFHAVLEGESLPKTRH